MEEQKMVKLNARGPAPVQLPVWQRIKGGVSVGARFKFIQEVSAILVSVDENNLIYKLPGEDEEKNIPVASVVDYSKPVFSSKAV